MSRRLVVAPRAAAQIRAAANWWIHNRDKAPDAFAEEIERGFETIWRLPSAGEPVQHSSLRGLRRLLLGRVHYHLYYILGQTGNTVEILALWHARRGEEPEI